MGCLKRERILGLVFEIGYHVYFYNIKRLPQSNRLRIKRYTVDNLGEFWFDKSEALRSSFARKEI